MNMETINETMNTCKYMGHKKKVSYVEGDVVLQDIKPDILSIVKVNRDICISNVKTENDKIKIEGDLNLSIIYIADDEGNSQKGMSSKISFSESIDFDGVNENSIVKLKYELGNVEYKVLSGRKVSVRIPVIFHSKVFENCDIAIIKGIRNDDAMQVQKTTQTLCGPIMKNSTEVEVKETIKLDDCNSPIGDMIECSMCIINKEYKLSYNKILAKADAKVKIVYIADNEKQNVESFETRVPIMGFIDFDGIQDKCNISLDYTICDYLIRPSYKDLQANSILLDANIKINAYAYECREEELVLDFYTPNVMLDMECEKNKVLRDLIEADEKIELSQTLVVPELDNTIILGIDGYASITDRNVLNGKIALTGNVEMNVLHSKNDSKIIENKKLELPFQQVIKLEKIVQGMEPIICVEVDEIRYAKNGENQIEVKTTLRVSVLADAEETINSITKLEVSDKEAPIMPSVVVYFVKPGDSLWSIAKMFRNTVENIKETNDLKEDTIYPGQRIIIPRLQLENSSHIWKK